MMHTLDALKKKASALSIAGGIAALAAAFIFRRNIGAEVTLFAPTAIPSDAAGWFALLQSDRWVALAYLDFFDAANYALLTVAFLAAYARLRGAHPGWALSAVIARTAGLAVSVALAMNGALSMLHLAGEYASAPLEARRTALLAAGEAVLALGGDAVRSTGLYAGYLLIALSGAVFAVLFLRRPGLARWIGVFGILAAGLDLAYAVSIPLAGMELRQGIGLATQPLAGLLLMVMHGCLGVWLLRRNSGGG